MVKIHRIWFNTERVDREDHYKITLFSRPRVSIHVDEYIWSFIEENIVKPHKLMRSEKHGYLLDISFDQFDPAKHRYFPLSSYNGPLREGVEMDSANRSYFREDFAGGKDRTTWFSMWPVPIVEQPCREKSIKQRRRFHILAKSGMDENLILGWNYGF